LLSAIIISLIVVITFSQAAVAVEAVVGAEATTGAEETDLPHLSLAEFLDELKLSFDDYLALVANYAAEGIHLHFLEQNAARYAQYQNDNPDLSVSTVIAYVNVNVDIGFYRGIQIVPDPDSIYLLVNKNFKLPTDWEPDYLVDLGRGRNLHEEAEEHFDLMRSALRDAGYNVGLRSVYRSFGRQTNSYNRNVNNYGRWSADQAVARPGHSEHQTGLTVDLTGFRPALPWLAENAHDFGFILRYPDGEYKKYHGYMYEPWHWRHVGTAIATAMYNEGIALYEEFYGKYLLSDVLHNIRAIVLEERSVTEAGQRELLESEERAKQAEQALLDREREILENRIAELEESNLSLSNEITARAASFDELKNLLQNIDNTKQDDGFWIWITIVAGVVLICIIVIAVMLRMIVIDVINNIVNAIKRLFGIIKNIFKKDK